MGWAGDKQLTELECCVLAVIWRCGPCSAYSVMAKFAQSLSAHWSASAGSIYPVVQRLRRRGLVDLLETRADARRKGDLKVSAAGETTVRQWIVGINPLLAAPTYDPIRTRILFLDAVEDDQRKQFLEGAISETSAKLEEVRKLLAVLVSEGQTNEEFGTLGAAYELEARLAWLRDIAGRATVRRSARRDTDL